jgi:hypothetical protein
MADTRGTRLAAGRARYYMNRKHANPAERTPHQSEQAISNRPDDEEEPRETATDEDDEDFEDDEDEEDEEDEESDDEPDVEA